MTEPQPPYGMDKPYGSEYSQPPQNPQYPPNQYGSVPPPGAYPNPGGYPAPGAYPGPGNPYPQPGAPYGVDPYGQPLSDKSKITAGLLGLFLGAFGVHRFYLGYTNIAIAQIAVTWLTCGIGAIWPFIDSIMILMGNVPDSDGRKLRD